MPANDFPVSLIVACRNEQESIGPCLTSLVAALPAAEILVVAGGTDGTFARACDLAQPWPQIRPIPNQPDWGKGHAVQRGVAEASAGVMAQFDADLQFSAEDLPRLLAPIHAGRSDLVLGSRFLRDSDRTDGSAVFLRDAGNRLLSFYVS